MTETIDFRARKFELEQYRRAIDTQTAALDRATDPVHKQAHKDAIYTAERRASELTPILLDMAAKAGMDFLTLDCGDYSICYELLEGRWEGFVSFAH